MSVMCREMNAINNIRRNCCTMQSGFSLVSAILLLVILASLGAFMLTFSSVQHATSAQDLEGIRAYQAARAGLEFGLYQVLRPGVASCGATTLALGGTLEGFTNNVLCNPSAVYTEGANTLTVFTITSRASQGAAGGRFRVERELQATVSR
jgi:MSHA biogenesis protein MshP